MWSSPLPLTEKKKVTRIIHNSPRDGCSCCYDYLIDCSLTRHPWNVYLKTIQHGDPASTHITTTNSRRHVEHQTQKRLRWIPRSSRYFFTFTFQIHFQMLQKSCLVVQWRDRKDHWTMPKLSKIEALLVCPRYQYQLKGMQDVGSDASWGLWDVQGSLGPPTWFDTTSQAFPTSILGCGSKGIRASKGTGSFSVLGLDPSLWSFFPVEKYCSRKSQFQGPLVSTGSGASWNNLAI